jgi:hypothetical protein
LADPIPAGRLAWYSTTELHLLDPPSPKRVFGSQHLHNRWSYSPTASPRWSMTSRRSGVEPEHKRVPAPRQISARSRAS